MRWIPPNARTRCLWLTTLTVALAGVELRAAPELHWQVIPGGRRAKLNVPTGGKTGFTLQPAEATGVAFTNHLAETTSARNRILQNGSGVALGDVDQDGWCDLYFCRLEGDNVLYRNLGGWRFEDITARAGVACPNQYSTGAVLADLDGDGDLDLLVNAIGGGTREFLNDGQARFTEVTGSRLVHRFGSTSMALGDIDGDNDLDLYVTNYRVDTYKDRPPGLNPEAKRVNGRIVVTPEDRFTPVIPRAGGVEVLEKGERDFLYLNDGKGQFAPVSWTTGAFVDEAGQPLVTPPTDWGLSVMFRDLNGDRTPDIYVCNDFFGFPDRCWINEGGRRFRAIDPASLRHCSVSSMGLDFADLNRDGHDDFLVTDMVSRRHDWRHRQRPNLMQGLVTQPLEDPQARPEIARNTLFLSRGDGSFAEIAPLSGVDFTEWSWGAVFLDVDLDGFEDLLIPTGNNHDVQDADVLRAQMANPRPDTPEDRLRNWQQFPALATPILAFRNQHDLTFTDATTAWGFGLPGPWQGMALADLDHDGDLDLVVNRLNGAAGLYRNDSTRPRLAVRLQGRPPNTRGIGARIVVHGGPVSQSQEMIAGGRYLSCDDSLRVFAAGTDTQVLTVEVTWRNGTVSRIPDALANHAYLIDESISQSIAPSSPPQPETPAPWFEDVSDRLAHQHADPAFDDFSRQPLLSRKRSTLGPGVSWFDLDGDGWDDLIVGGRRGAPVARFQSNGRGGFTPFPGPSPTARPEESATTVLCLRTTTGLPRILAGMATMDPDNTPTGAVQIIDPPRQDPSRCVDGLLGGVGPLALADLDGDGFLDLFVGGRWMPARYPESVPSHLWRRISDDRPGASGSLDLQNDALLARIGMVSGATFADLTGDGYPELILACDWGALRVYRNDHGRLAEWDVPLRWGAAETHATPPRPEPPFSRPQPPALSHLTGWWNAVAAGDFDGDGRLDLVAANWGRNTRFQRYLSAPLRVYYGDIHGTGGGGDILEVYYEPTLRKWVPWRDYETILRAWPFLTEIIPTHQAYGEAGVDDLFGPRIHRLQLREAATLDSLLLLNRQDHFEIRPLPIEAQFAPAFGLSVADIDGDGCEDLFLSQNFFGVEPETARYDAGCGLWLRGDGRGNFTPLSPAASGVSMSGEQRACAVSDFDADGRIDLVVTQNRGPTKLYRNRAGQPGLRVRVAGPQGNHQGFGVQLRLACGGRPGPTRYLPAGSGYWSQDSATTVLALKQGPRRLEALWPDGRRTATDVPITAREIELSESGALRTLR